MHAAAAIGGRCDRPGATAALGTVSATRLAALADLLAERISAPFQRGRPPLDTIAAGSRPREPRTISTRDHLPGRLPCHQPSQARSAAARAITTTIPADLVGAQHLLSVATAEIHPVRGAGLDVGVAAEALRAH